MNSTVKVLPFVAIGLVVVALAIGGILLMQRGSRMVLEGSLQKVRTVALDDNSCAVIADFRVHNPSDFPMVVSDVTISATGAKDETLEGIRIADIDAKQMFQFFPQLGQKYNSSISEKTRIAPGQTIDRMAAARFEVPEKDILARKNLVVHVKEVDGSILDLSEKPLK